MSNFVIEFLNLKSPKGEGYAGEKKREEWSGEYLLFLLHLLGEKGYVRLLFDTNPQIRSYFVTNKKNV